MPYSLFFFKYMTKKQLELLNYIREYRDKYKISPSILELGKCFKRAGSTIHERLHSLVSQGYLIRSKDYVRGYKLTNKKPYKKEFFPRKYNYFYIQKLKNRIDKILQKRCDSCLYPSYKMEKPCSDCLMQREKIIKLLQTEGLII